MMMTTMMIMMMTNLKTKKNRENESINQSIMPVSLLLGRRHS